MTKHRFANSCAPRLLAMVIISVKQKKPEMRSKRLRFTRRILMLLDLGFPDGDGLDVIKELRGWSQLPVIVLSARGQEQDKVTALELGADDYLTKPFGAAELLARISVALRHARAGNNQEQESVFSANGLTVDFSKRLVSVDGQDTHLTPTEYKLLCVMVKHAGKVVTHGQLLRDVWGKHASEQGYYLRIYMQHLRIKTGR